MAVRELETPHGVARAHIHACGEPRGALVLGHGAGGGVGAPDLVAVTRAANAERLTVALIEQPYRVAGKRSPPRAPVLDAAFVAVIAQLADGGLGALTLITGGRSSGARVACRTAADTAAAGVLCLAFPLVPPARGGAPTRPSRLPELEAVSVPVLIVQGANDPFGRPTGASNRRVVAVAGDHSLRKDTAAVAAAVRAWLGELLDGR